MPYSSKLQIAPTNYHLIDAQRKHPIEKYSRRFFGRKKSKIPMRTNSSQHYGHLCVYGLLKKTPIFLLFFFFFLLLPPPHLFSCKPHINPPTPPQSDKGFVVTVQKKEKSGRGRKAWTSVIPQLSNIKCWMHDISLKIAAIQQHWKAQKRTFGLFMGPSLGNRAC